MQKVTDYKIVMSYSPIELEKEVKSLINQGWVPAGGISIIQSPTTEKVGDMIRVQTISHQAMIKISE